jgi:hypothetical protein
VEAVSTPKKVGRKRKQDREAEALPPPPPPPELPVLVSIL